MKKIRLIVGIVLFAVAVGAAFAIRRPAGPDPLTHLKQFSESERTMYFDPADSLKKMPASAKAGMTAQDLQPVAIRVMKLTGVQFSEIKKIVHHDLTAGNKWSFLPTPKRPSASVEYEIIQAFKGPPGTGVSLGTPEESFTVIPRLDNFALSSSHDPAKKITEFTVMHMRQLKTWEVVWIKLKNIGRNPYSTQQDISQIFGM